MVSDDPDIELFSQKSTSSSQRSQLHRAKATETENETRRRSERIRAKNNRLAETVIEEAQRRAVDAVRHYQQRQQDDAIGALLAEEVNEHSCGRMDRIC